MEVYAFLHVFNVCVCVCIYNWEGYEDMGILNHLNLNTEKYKTSLSLVYIIWKIIVHNRNFTLS